MDNDFTTQLNTKVTTHRLLSPFNSPVGCTLEEVQKIQVAQQIPYIPYSYSQFMQTMGKNIEHYFMHDWVLSYPYVLENKHEAQIILSHNKSNLILPSDSLVFGILDTRKFSFVLTKNKHDDPEVYHFTDSVSTFLRIKHSFSQYVLSII